MDIQRAGRIGGFFARHSLALLVTVAAPCVLWTVAYCALLLWALVVGGGVGSPASYLLTLVVLLLYGTAGALTLLFPSAALAEWLARRLGLPVLAQIPLSVAILAVLSLAVAGLASAVGYNPWWLRDVSAIFGVLFLVHLLPLGLYWWVAQGGPLVLSLLRRLRGALLRSLELP
jgi:hypothetical protein